MLALSIRHSRLDSGGRWSQRRFKATHEPNPKTNKNTTSTLCKDQVVLISSDMMLPQANENEFEPRAPVD